MRELEVRAEAERPRAGDPREVRARRRAARSVVCASGRPSAAERAAVRWSGPAPDPVAASRGRHPAGRARRSADPELEAAEQAPVAVHLQRPRPDVDRPAPHAVRPMRRACVAPARRSRPAPRTRARSRGERLLAAVAVVCCSATVVVVLGLLGDAAAGWNAAPPPVGGAVMTGPA